MSTEGLCWWCEKPLPKGRTKFCTEAHRQKYKRAAAAESWVELVQRLGPHVKVSGKFIYEEMLTRLAGSVNEPV